MFGGSAFGATTFAGPDTIVFSRIFVPDKTAVLQIRNSSGQLLYRLEAWFDASVEQKVNEPDRITFSLALIDPAVAASAIIAPNEIWWYDNTHEIQRKFLIQEGELSIDDTRAIYRVMGEDYLVQLAQEVNDVTGDDDANMSVSEALSLIIAAQIGSPAITLGAIDGGVGATSVSFPNASGRTFLSLLNDIRTQNVGGYFRVNQFRQLNWFSYSSSAHIEYNMSNNLSGYSERMKSRSIYNRIYVRGAAQPDGTRIGCSSPGYRQSSTSIAAYNTRPHYIVNSRIKTEAAANAVADMFLDLHANPPTDRTMPVIDTQALKRGTVLSEDDINEIITIGMPVKIRIPALAPSANFLSDVETMNIKGIKRDLTQFAQVELTFGEPDADVFDVIADANTQSNNNSTEDTTDIIELIPENHIDLADCPPTYTPAGELVKTNTTEDGMDYTSGGSAGALLQRNTDNDSAIWLAPGSGNQVVITNDDGDAHTHSTGGSALYILRKNSANDGIEWAAEGSGGGGLSVDVQAKKIDLQTSTAPALGEVTNDTDDQYNDGFQYFPDGAVDTGEYRQIATVIHATTLGGLGNPAYICKGFVTAGSDKGWFNYTNETGTTADWVPENVYSEAS